MYLADSQKDTPVKSSNVHQNIPSFFCLTIYFLLCFLNYFFARKNINKKHQIDVF
jgi:hypothetical protein